MSKFVKNIFIASIVTAIVAAVIGGVILLGSPAKERMRKLDKRRVENLRAITSAVDLYWTRHKSLSPSIESLSKEPGLSLNTLDPETGQPYEYKVLNERNYELCTNFAFATAEEQNIYYKDFWSHGPGRQCFHLEVREVSQ